MNINKILFSFIRILFAIMLVLLVAYGAVQLCTIGYDFGYRVFTEPAMSEEPGEDVLVQIKEDMSALEIGTMLKSKGLIRDENLFVVQLMCSAYSKKMYPGVYTLNTSMTAKEMMVHIAETYEAEHASTETETGE